MPLYDESSERLDALRFPLIVGIVFLHAYGSTVSLEGGRVAGVAAAGPAVDFIREFVSQGLARTAVPAFFLISGYLFFADVSWSPRTYTDKLKRRTRSLLVPMVIWNLAVLGLLAVAQTSPLLRGYFSGANSPIAEYTAWQYLRAVFGIGQMPIAYQFWFIRDLMVLAVLTPLVWLGVRYARWPVLAILAGCWVFDIWPLFAPSSEATLFFVAGAAIAVGRASLFYLDRWGAFIAAVYAVLLVADTLLTGSPVHHYLHKGEIVAGVAAVLFATGCVVLHPGLKRVLLGLSGAAFFVFAAHEPALTIVRKMTYKVLAPSSPLMLLALYLLLPTLVIAALLLVWILLARFAPRFVGIVTGSRSGKGLA